MKADMSERIRSARLAKGLSMDELARLARLPARELSRYERGATVPGSDVLCRLAAALEVKVGYFLRAERVEVRCLQGGRPRLSSRQVLALEWHVGEHLERYLAVEGLLGLGRREGLPRLVPHPADLHGGESAELLAGALRREWDLGLDPIANLCETLEDHGVKVVPFGEISADRVAVACLADGQPVIALRPEADGARQRFAIAHELGRLIVAADQPPADLSAERWCQRFAAAVLVPREAALAEAGERRSELGYRELHSLKHRWGLGMLAWCDRVHDLGVISPGHRRRMLRMFRSRGWDQREPGDPVGFRRSWRFERLVHRAVAEDVIGPARAADLLNRPLVEVRREFGWPDA